MFKEDVLFHYTKADTAINYILKNNTIKLGKLNYVNDPKESKNWPFKLFCYNSISHDKFKVDLFEEIHNDIIKSTNILCFSKSQEEKDEDRVHAELDEGYSYNRMWAQYSENQKGVCLVFNKKRLIEKFINEFETKLHFLGDVEYLDPGKNGRDGRDDPYLLSLEELTDIGVSSYMKKHIEKYSNDLFFRKHINWRDENEFRFVVYGVDSDEDLYLSISGTIDAIIIGEEFEEDKLNDIRILAREIGTKIYRVYTRGWAVHLMEVNDENVISLNGISYPTHFYYELLYAQAIDNKGKRRTIFFDFPNNGSVSVIE